MKKWKAPFLFALCMMPIGAIAGYFTGLYQLDFMGEATKELMVSQLGSAEALLAVGAVQVAVYAFLFGFFGYILACKLGLMKPFRLEKKPLAVTAVLSLAVGVLLSLDYWVFGAVIPGVQEANAATLQYHVIIASILYGGVIEELMMRLVVMSLLAWLSWKLFFRKARTVPVGVLIAANILSALLFAAGHLPATVQLFGTLTPLILLRCFLLNSLGGLVFGWLYRKHGIQYAMVSHALCHIVCKVIWLVFI